jgi:predicted RNA polymerase sigma factor
MSDSATHRAINAVWRIESAKIIAGLARIVRDIGLAEDLAHDALIAALEQWPEQGIPDNPAAGLMAAAKHRAIDRLRRSTLQGRKHDEIVFELKARSDSSCQTRPRRRGLRRVPTRRVAYRQRPRARSAA